MLVKPVPGLDAMTSYPPCRRVIDFWLIILPKTVQIPHAKDTLMPRGTEPGHLVISLPEATNTLLLDTHSLGHSSGLVFSPLDST